MAQWTDTVAWGRTVTDGVRADALLRRGDHAAALAHAEAAYRQSLAFRGTWYPTPSRARLGAALGAAGRAREAHEAFLAAAGFRNEGHRWMLASALDGAAAQALALRDAAGAAAHAVESAASLGPEPEPWFLARALDALATVCVAPTAGTGTAGARAAARLLGAAAELRRRSGVVPRTADQARHDAARAAAEQVLTAAAADGGRGQEERFDALLAAGATLRADALPAVMREAAALVRRPAQGRAEESASSRVQSRAPQHRAADAPAPAAEARPAAGARALRTDVLGGFAVWRDGRALADDELPGSKVRELLLWLVLHPRGGTKEQVGLALWPEASAAQLRSNFHVTMHHLRRALGDARWATRAG
ncbi:hypothetical protein tb265_46250 [Gemmatimonadetes bacterium T265]|nr:hypothetical protein tb265_46250 [Gemmatimonadetes bacterium T265]